MTRVLVHAWALEGLGVMILFVLAACSATGGGPAARDQREAPGPGWTRHQDPAGFAVDLPDGWKVTPDRQSERLTASGPGGERVVIWPMAISQKNVDPAAASALLLRLAGTVDARGPWTPAASGPTFARAVSRTAAVDGVAVMTWGPSPAGTAVCVYLMQAAAGRYGASVDTFGRIVGSFRVSPAGGTEKAPSGPAPLRFASWTDPTEQAFSTVVPEGWRVVGGSYRVSNIDIRMAITLISPDGAIHVTMGDPNLGGFTVPNAAHQFAGMREGMNSPLGDGTPLTIYRFLPGQVFARHWADQRFRSTCSGLTFTGNNDRPDLVAGFVAGVTSEGLPNAHVTAGDVAFSCTINGQPAVGSFIVSTAMMPPSQTTVWMVYRLYGYLAPPDRRAEAEEVVGQVARAFKIEPAWHARQRQLARATVYQDMLRSQEIQRRAFEAISRTLSETSNIVTSSYWQRQKVYDEISRKRENAILGTVDVVDPSSGRQYKVTYNADYHWMDGQGGILGTLTDTPPGLGWRKLVDLP
jgi:hypothetical protein